MDLLMTRSRKLVKLLKRTGVCCNNMRGNFLCHQQLRSPVIPQKKRNPVRTPGEGFHQSSGQVTVRINTKVDHCQQISQT